MRRILIIEDDRDTREMLEVTLASQVREVRSAENRDDGYALIMSGWIPDLVLLDYCMEGMDAEEFMDKLIAFCPKLPRVVVMTAAGAADERAKRLGVPEVLRKPFNPNGLLLKIEWYSI
jgi:CheY-like chemotaxis protein